VELVNKHELCLTSAPIELTLGFLKRSGSRSKNDLVPVQVKLLVSVAWLVNGTLSLFTMNVLEVEILLLEFLPVFRFKVADRNVSRELELMK
jgi:hypothetical protein